jgi:hypothetical protein
MDLDLENGLQLLLESGTRYELEEPSTDVPTIPPTKHDGISGKHYPDFFPCPAWQYAERASSYQRRIPMESGWKRQRKQWPQFGRAINLTWVMTTDEFDNWSAWVEANAYDWFYIYLDDYGSGKVPELVRLSTDVSFRYDSYDVVTATATGEVYREGAILDPDCVPPYFISQPGLVNDGTAHEPRAYYDKIKEIAQRRSWTVAMWIFDDGSPRAADPVPYQGAWDYGDPNGIGSPFDLNLAGTNTTDRFLYAQPSLTGDKRASLEVTGFPDGDGRIEQTSIDFGPLVAADGSWTMSIVVEGATGNDHLSFMQFLNSSNQGGGIGYDRNTGAIEVTVITAIGGDVVAFPYAFGAGSTVITAVVQPSLGKLSVSCFANGGTVIADPPVDDVTFEKPFTPYTFSGPSGGLMRVQYGWFMAGAVSIPEIQELWEAWEKTKE